MAPQALLDGLAARRTPALARAISMVENATPGFEELLAKVHGQLGRGRRIGVTGPPGAGKSTLIERLAAAFRAAGQTVGVIAVDPSSPFTGGALLGDRIRMERASVDEGVFIRSMASRGSVGGMATTTGEVADVMDAFGFDRILIETVGVGQSELDVAAAADTTVVVLVPESGDGIQVMKAGLMEIADVFVVNKADRPGADRVLQELEVALGLRAGQAFRHIKAHHGSAIPEARGARREKNVATEWEPPVLATIAAQGEGVGELVAALDRHFTMLESTGKLNERRSMRMLVRTRDVIDRAVKRWVWSNGQKEEMDAVLKDVGAGTRSPYEAAAGIVARLNGSVAYERS
ncbi:MAG: methylmalonyl Co-A mutase-associated GTPase MeaB [Gemmatimonadales bacterium]